MSTFTYCPLCATALVERALEGAPRAACPSCDYVHYDNPTPVLAAIVQRGDDVVLVRNVGWPETWFGLVSGFMERGETPEEGLLREVREELGVQGRDVVFVGNYAFRRVNQVILAYHVTIDDAPSPNPEEIAAIKHVPVTKLKPWPFGTGHAVRDWLASLEGP